MANKLKKPAAGPKPRSPQTVATRGPAKTVTGKAPQRVVAPPPKQSFLARVGVLLGVLLLPLLLVGGVVGGLWYLRESGLFETPKPPASRPGPISYGPPAADLYKRFKDDVQSNANPKADAFELVFVNRDGERVSLADFRGKKNLVLVMTRGFTSQGVCPGCSAQTSRLIAQYPEFQNRDAEVLVVFPGPKDKVDGFLQASQPQSGSQTVPFTILLDEDLKAVERLGIQENLAKPSTYILDKEGKVRFAYVGANVVDRPSIKAMLQQLDAIGQK